MTGHHMPGITNPNWCIWSDTPRCRARHHADQAGRRTPDHPTHVTDQTAAADRQCR